MPNIAQYENQVDRITPSDRGIQADLMAARRTGAFYHQIGEDIGGAITTVGNVVEHHETVKEISQGAAASANMGSGLTTNWHSAFNSADPNNHQLAQDWRQQTLEPALQKFQEGFNTPEGKAWALQQADRWRQHFYETTAADQSTLAGQAMVQNATVLKNQGSDTIFKDPTAFDVQAGTAEHAIEAQVAANPNLSPEAAAHARTNMTQAIKNQYSKAAIMGTAQTNPDAALSLLNSGKFDTYLDATEKKEMESYIEGQRRIIAGSQKAAQAAQIKKEDGDFSAAALKVGLSIGVDPKGVPIVPSDYFDNVRALTNMPGASERHGSHILTMMSAGERALQEMNKKESDITDPAAGLRLQGKFDEGSLDPIDVDGEYAHGHLSGKDYSKWHEIASDMVKPSPELKRFQAVSKDIYTTASKIIAPGAGPMGLLKPAEAKNLYDFKSWLHTDWDFWVNQGRMSQDDWEHQRLSPTPTKTGLQSIFYDPKGLPAYSPGSYRDQTTAALQVMKGQQPTALAPNNRGGLNAGRMSDLDKIAGGH